MHILMKRQYRNYMIRPWQVSDRQVVAHLVKTVLAEYGMAFEPAHTDRDALQVESCYWQTGGEFWVIERYGHIVGSGAYHPSHRGKNAVELRKMFILPPYRSQGLGRYLLKQLEQSAADKGFTEMWLETATVLQAAIALYESSGYQLSTGVDTARCDRIYRKPLRAAIAA